MIATLRWNEHKENVCVIGANQEGKSTLALKLASDLANAGRNVIIYAEHENFNTLNPNCVVHTVSALKGQGLEIFNPYVATDELFNSFIEHVYNNFRYAVIILDELHNRVTKNNISKILKIFVQNCNNRNMSYVATFHSPSEIHNSILRAANIKIVFYLDLPREIDYVCRWIDPICEGFSTGEIQQFQGVIKKRHEKAEIFSL